MKNISVKPLHIAVGSFILLSALAAASITDIRLLRTQASIPADIASILENGEITSDLAALEAEPRIITQEEHEQGYVSGEVILKLKGDTDVSILQFDESADVKEVIAALEEADEVEYAEPNVILYPASGPLEGINDPHINLQYAIHNYGQVVGSTTGTPGADTKAPEAWPYAEGEDIIVAVIDTGVAYDHPDLINNMWDGLECKDRFGNFLGDCIHGYDYFSGNKDPYPAAHQTPPNPHGTFIAGLIAAEKNNETGIAGIAPQAKIMALRAGNEGFTTTALIHSIQFAKHNGAHIINASWTATVKLGTTMENEIANFPGLFIPAAGNQELNLNTEDRYPCKYVEFENLICVGATGNQDELAIFSSQSGSNYGSNYVHVGAPGKLVYSTTYNHNSQSLDIYAHGNGTSYAAPYVAGLAALLMSYNPELSLAEVKQAILDTGDTIPALEGKTITGKRINAGAALASIVQDGTPVTVNPVHGAEHVSRTPVLTASVFVDPEEREHTDTEWRIATDDSFSSITWSRQAEEAETTTQVSPALEYNTQYYWQVRYQAGEEWSDWSEATSFTTLNQYTLTYTAGDNGSLQGELAQTVDYGEDGTAVDAVPDEGYVFDVWSDDVSDNPRTDANVTEDISVTALFAPESITQYTLTYTAGEGGTIAGAASQTVSEGNDSSPVEAVPNEGYTFNQWSDGVTDNPRTDTNVQEDITVEAQFTATATPTPTITPTPTPTPTTTVTPTPTPTPTPAPPLQQGVIPFINSMFREVYGRNPSVDEWRYWAQRSLNDKPDRAEILGAMQWHRIVNGRSPILLAGISTPPPSQQQPPSPVPPDTDTVSAINRLFRSVFNRNPTVAAWHFWANRVVSGEKATIPELLGAMQWQRLFGGR